MPERACAACGAPVDPLRAPVVAILDGRFVYFCSQACRARSDAISIAPPPTPTLLTPPPPPVRVHLVEPRDVSAPTAPPATEAPQALEEARARVDAATTAPKRSAAIESVSTPAPASALATQTPTPVTAAAALGLPTGSAKAATPAHDADGEAPVSRAPRSLVGLDRTPPPSLARVTMAPSLRPPTQARAELRWPVLFGRWLRMLGALLALGAVGLALIDSIPQAARLGLSTIAELALLAVIAMPAARRSRSPLEIEVDAHLGAPLVSAISAAGACLALAWALLLSHRSGEGTAVATATWVVLAAAAAELLAESGTRGVVADAHDVLFALERPSGELAPNIGESFVVGAGDVIHEDVRVVAGVLVCELWGARRMRVRRKVGQPVPAGSFVREGEATVRVLSIGRGRAFARLLTEALERSDHGAPAVRTLHWLAPIVAATLVAFAIALALLSRGRVGPTAAAAMAAVASLMIPPARRLAIRDQLQGIVESVRRGAAFRDAEAFGLASRVRSAIFVVGGTLLSSEPDACDVESLGELAPIDVLAFAAAALGKVDDPRSRAIRTAASARGARPPEVRNASFLPGLGAIAELGSGRTVVVGGRSLCFSQHVPTAEHEARIGELERAGRDVILVAHDGRIIGLLALQMPLRSGALGAISRLHDLEIEPVLLGGAARDRLVAIGQAVDVENVRAEVAPEARAEEVRRVAESGGPVAVIGRGDDDRETLEAADVSIALLDAGSTPEPAAIALAHEQLVPAIDVLALAQATRAKVAATLAVGLSPVLLAALPVAFGLVRATYAPLAAIAATLALAVRDLVAAALPEGATAEDDEDPISQAR
jgi:cation transport ATPase